PPPTALYPLSLHDALPISEVRPAAAPCRIFTIALILHGRPPQMTRFHRISLAGGGTGPALWLETGIACRLVPRGPTRALVPTDKDRKSTRLNSSHVKISYA